MADRKTLITERIFTGAADRYSANIKCLFLRINGTMVYTGQHERCDVLEKKALAFATNTRANIDFEIKTGLGVLIERGKVRTKYGTFNNQTGVAVESASPIFATVQR